MSIPVRPQITPQQIQQYKDEGYFILENVVPPDHLELLRNEATFAVERINARMDARKTDVIGISHRNKRYFSAEVYKERPVLRQFLFSDLMADICRATLGPEASLFIEQYVIKCADKEMKFSWHQDSGYVENPYHKPYVTCWIPLDDVSEKNGTVYILPYSVSGIRSWVRHIAAPGTNDLVGYFGKERGIPVNAPAGSIAVFSSVTFHSSGPNMSDKLRRIYLAQYASEMVKKENGERWGNFEPFLSEGKFVGTLNP